MQGVTTPLNKANPLQSIPICCFPMQIRCFLALPCSVPTVLSKVRAADTCTLNERVKCMTAQPLHNACPRSVEPVSAITARNSPALSMAENVPQQRVKHIITEYYKRHAADKRMHTSRLAPPLKYTHTHANHIKRSKHQRPEREQLQITP
jgi:hypothetical protein